MDTLYTKAEILAFARNNITFESDIDKYTRSSILATTISEIEQLPVDQQLILIQGYHPNHIRRGAGGLYTPDKKQAKWGYEEYGTHGINTFHHECWHRIDHLLNPLKGGYYSNANEAWRCGVDNYLKKNSKGKNKDYKPDSSLYLNSFKINAHLSADEYKIDFDMQKDNESLAEMGTHYNSLHRDYAGDMDKIEQALKGEYPELWPLFKTEILPHTKKLGEKYNEERNNIINAFTQAQRVLKQKAGIPFNEAASEENARLLLAALGKDKTNNVTEELQRRADNDFDQIPAYIAKSQELCIKNNKDFNETQTAKKANYLAYKGKITDASFQLDIKLGVFKEPIERYKSAIQRMDTLYAHRTFTKPFDENDAYKIIKESGQERLEQYTSQLNDMNDNYLSFKEALEKLFQKNIMPPISELKISKYFEKICYTNGNWKSYYHLKNHHILKTTSQSLQEDDLLSRSLNAFGPSILNVLTHLIMNTYGDKDEVEDVLNSHEALKAKSTYATGNRVAINSLIRATFDRS